LLASLLAHQPRSLAEAEALFRDPQPFRDSLRIIPVFQLTIPDWDEFARICAEHTFQITSSGELEIIESYSRPLYFTFILQTEIDGSLLETKSMASVAPMQEGGRVAGYSSILGNNEMRLENYCKRGG
jgi:hypothetical protein